MAPKAVMAEGKSVIGREDHDRIALEPAPCQRVQNLTDAIIDQAHLGIVVAQRCKIVGYLQQGAEIGPAFFGRHKFLIHLVKSDGLFADPFARHRMHGRFVIEIAEPVLCPALDRWPVTIGTVIGQQQQKRLVRLGGARVDILNRLFGKEIHRVAVIDEAFAIHRHLVAVEIQRVAARHGDPMIDAVLGFGEGAEMILADHRRGIAGPF